MTHIIAESLILTAWLEIVNPVSETNEAKAMEKVTFSNNVISKRIDGMSEDTDNSDPGFITSENFSLPTDEPVY